MITFGACVSVFSLIIIRLDFVLLYPDYAQDCADNHATNAA